MVQQNLSVFISLGARFYFYLESAIKLNAAKHPDIDLTLSMGVSFKYFVDNH